MILLSIAPGPGALSAPEISKRLSAAGQQVEITLEPHTKLYVGPAAFAGSGTVVENPTRRPEIEVFAPANAPTLARLAHGLQATATTKTMHNTIIFTELLDLGTASHPAVRRNIALLREDGIRVVEGVRGGMATADEVVAAVLGGVGGILSGVRVLVTAGGTREPIDSVRFVGNRSSGKMGLAVAREAARMGAEVKVVAANVERVEPGVSWVAVETFGELREEVGRLAREADALVMAAAVSDFTPAAPVGGKIRRGERVTLELEATEDILKEVRGKNPDLFMVGFAATHGDPVGDAREKLRSKSIDLVVGNDVSRPGIGFGSDENEVYVVGRDEEKFVPQAGKEEVARVILDVLSHEMNEAKRR